MGLWNSLFKGSAKADAVGSALPKLLQGDVKLDPQLPDRLKDPDDVDFEQLFSQSSSDELLRLCRQIPVEELILYPIRIPSRPDILTTDAMSNLMTACFRMARHAAKRKDKPQLADSLVPRLIKRIEEHEPDKVIPLAWTVIRDLAMDLIRGGRNCDALQCLHFVERTILGKPWTKPGNEGAFWMVACHANIAWTSTKRQEIEKAITLIGTLKGEELKQMQPVLQGLKSRLANAK